MTLYLVRHAHAGSRHDWDGDDRERPLSPKGFAQAAGLLDHFGDLPITQVLSSPLVRCQQTVAPVAHRRGLDVEISAALAEGAKTAHALDLLASLGDADVMLCSHGDVIPEVIRALADSGVTIIGRRSAAKASTYVIERDGKRFKTATYVDPPGP